MWTKLLLQAFVSLLPVFMFQLWMYRINQRQKMVSFFCISYGLAMLCCFALSTNTVNGFDLDLRFFPLLMGSLYGGYPAAIILSIEYIILRIPLLADRIETTGFIIFFMLFIPLILLTIRPFQLARMKQKFGIAFMLMGFCGIYYGLLYISYTGLLDLVQIGHDILGLLGAGLLCSLATVLTLYTINSVLEHYQLQHQLRRMSSNYMNEVHKLQQFIDQMAMGTVDCGS